MGDAVMERVARVPELPEVETTWVRSDALGNSRRQSQLGGPMGRSAAQAIEGANHDAAAGLIPLIQSSRDMSATIDEVRDRIWIERTDLTTAGFFVPGFGAHASSFEVGLDALSGGRGGAGRSVVDTVAIGMPRSRAPGLSSSGRTSLRADEVAALLGLDTRAWSAAADVAAGDLWRASELPEGAIVRGSHSNGGRRGVDVPKFGLQAPVTPKFDSSDARSSQVTVQRAGDLWVAEVLVERGAVLSIGVGLGTPVPGMDFGASKATASGAMETVTLCASVKDTRAVAILAEVVRRADGLTLDPVEAVPGARALMTKRSSMDSSGGSSRVGILMNSFSLDDAWDSSFTLTETADGESVTGAARATNRARLGIDNAFTREFWLDQVELSGGTESAVAYAATEDASSIVLRGGTTGTTFDVHANETQVRLTASDADVIMQAARSEQVWKHLYGDHGVQADWLTLRTDLLQAKPDTQLKLHDPDMALRVARLKLVAAYVMTDTDAIEPLLNALGRGKLARVDKVVGVLECWPEGSESTQAIYDQLGQWMELLPRNDWGGHDPLCLLRQLRRCAETLYDQIEAFTRVPERARLEMLGQVLAWRDTMDDALCRYGSHDDSTGATASHRPSTTGRLELLAGECRSEASPHLFVLEPLLCRSGDLTPEQETSFDALSGIIGYWKVVAAELRDACARDGKPESAWLVRPRRGAMEAERDLDPPLRTWNALRGVVDQTRRGLTTESTYAAL